LPPGSLQTLCQQSLHAYPDWIRHLEQDSGLPTGYWPCGILAVGSQHWLRAVEHPAPEVRPVSGSELEGLQTGLALQKAVWLPQEGQVNSRLLVTALVAAAQKAGIRLLENTPVTWQTQADQITGLATPTATLTAQHYILAMGSWSGVLPQVPVYPRKGQMFAVADPSCQLQRVLYGEGVYIVPRQEGRIVVGATVEEVGFTEGNSPDQIQALWAQAIRIYPRLATLPLLEQWWGFRPSTPDLAPILGSSPYRNLTLATGHDRNGILLAPLTSRLVADWVITGREDPQLAAFGWGRFTPAQS
jgi:glycine/D-amino acid oxidase-like deaminating enzyme